MLPRDQQQILENETEESFNNSWLRILGAKQAIAVKTGKNWIVVVDGIEKNFTDDNTVHEVIGEFHRALKSAKGQRRGRHPNDPTGEKFGDTHWPLDVPADHVLPSRAPAVTASPKASTEPAPTVTASPAPRKFVKASMPEMIAAVRDYAKAHYEKGGWYYVVESFSDEELVEIIDKATSVNGAIINVRVRVKLIDERRKEIQSA